MLFGNKIKELRDEQGLLQRQLAAFLEIASPMFSKIERGDRRAKREQVIKLAEYLHQDEKEMLTLWLADKFICDTKGESERKCLHIVYVDMKKRLRETRKCLIISADQPGLEPGTSRL